MTPASGSSASGSSARGGDLVSSHATTAPYCDLRDYAAIGDGRTVALIASSGRVDWLPVPSLDSLPIFAGILDDTTGGVIELVPEGDYEVTRRYVGRSNVLATTFTTKTGSVRMTDALVTGIAGRLPWTELARRVEGLDGHVRMRWQVRPGTAFRTISPWIQESDGRTIIRAGTVTIGVTGENHGPEEPERGDLGGDALRGSFRTKEGSEHVLVVSGTDDEPLHIPRPDRVKDGIDRTIRAWESWSDEFHYDGPWAEHVQRSALALKLLIYSPTGSIAAAATTSLPENPDGGKNWDYRYAWVRDLAYTTEALVRFGLREETHAAISWLLRTVKANGPDVHIFYDLGGHVPDEVAHYDAPGWHGIGPVVTGNGAQGQLQLGVFGDLFSIVRAYVAEGNFLDQATGRFLADVADRTCNLWRNRDAGMWELTTDRHYTSSKMGCWQALDAAIALAEGGHIEGRADRWRIEAERIREWIGENCWSDSRQAYVMHPGTDALDASVLLHAPSGFDRGERMASTIDAITGELARGNLVYRYSGVDEEEKTFVACAFWRAAALACVGRVAEASAAMDDLVTMSNDVGLYSEMIDAVDGSFWGNLPQGLSHLALINAALTIEQLS